MTKTTITKTTSKSSDSVEASFLGVIVVMLKGLSSISIIMIILPQVIRYIADNPMYEQNLKKIY